MSDYATTDRSSRTIGPFSGLDRRPGKFNLDPTRALDEENYVYRNGLVQKRHGHEEALDLVPTQYVALSFDGEADDEVSTNAVTMNGLCSFKAEDGNMHVVAHIGKLLYEITGLGTDSADISPISAGTATIFGVSYPSCYEFEDYRSSAFIGNGRLYFLGGNKYMMLRFLSDGTTRLEPIENGDDTYIPTTTISITYEYAKASGRASLDSVNLLSDKRRNTLLSGVGKDDTSEAVGKHYRYVLDAPLITRDRVRDMADFKITLNERASE